MAPTVFAFRIAKMAGGVFWLRWPRMPVSEEKSEERRVMFFLPEVRLNPDDLGCVFANVRRAKPPALFPQQLPSFLRKGIVNS